MPRLRRGRVVGAVATVASLLLTLVSVLAWPRAAPERRPPDLARQARDAVERGADVLAEQLLSTAIAGGGVSPRECAGYHVERARTRMRQPKLVEALQDLDRAVELDPTSVVALHERGGLRRRMGDLEQSIRDLERAAALAPRDVDVANDHAVSLLEAHRTDEARSALASALALDPENWRVNFNLGRLLRESGEYDRARERLERALAANPAEGDVYVELARVLARSGDEAAARRALSDGVAAAPAHAPLRVAYASSLLGAQRLRECEEQCDVALTLDGSLWDAYFARGVCRDLSGRPAEAIEDLETSLRLHPGRVATLVKLADLHDRLGNTRRAIELLGQAAQDPKRFEEALERYPEQRRDRLESMAE